MRIAVTRMVGAIKEISIAKGHDPRDFTLVAYGGAGPMHAAFIAEELDMTRVLVPPAPGNFSAFGSLISDLRRDYVRTRLIPTRDGDFADVERMFGALEDEARRELTGEGIPPEKQAKVFEPYFTTKEKGTGLGLAIVKHNTELYNGTVTLESEPGKGSTFRVKLPAKSIFTVRK